MTLTELKNQRQSRVDQILEDNQIFWAFGDKQWQEAKEKYQISPTNKVCSIGAGGYILSKNVESLNQAMRDLNAWYKEAEKKLDDKIRLKRISAERYDDMLCVLPPIYHPNGVFQVSEPYDHVMLDGAEHARYDTFVKKGNNYYSAGILTEGQASKFANSLAISIVRA